LPCLNRSGPYGDHGQKANRLEEWFVKDRCMKLFNLCHSHIKPKTGLHVISVAVLYAIISPGSVSAEDWYVDNAVALSGNGTSWASAWKSFGNINWGSIHGGDTIYISGGGVE
jgi:hypothetical protein